MTKATKIVQIVMLTSFLALGSCGGGGAKVKSTMNATTLGQELEDLEKAHKDGLISDDEYKKARKAILNRYK